MGQFILSTSEQTAKISKTGFAKLGTLQFGNPNGLGFQVKKTDCDKFQSLKNLGFFTRTTHYIFPLISARSQITATL